MRSALAPAATRATCSAPCCRLGYVAGHRRRLACASSNQEPGPSATTTQQQDPVDPKIVREYKAWGMQVLESNEPLPGPETEKDFWDGEQFQKFGEVMEKWFLPGLVVLGLICGGIAAQTYNSGADTFQTVAKPDSLPQLIPADALVAPPK